MFHSNPMSLWLGIFILVAASLRCAMTVSAQSVSNGFWQAQSIYQIVTDRFFDGDASNNNADGNYSATGSGSRSWRRFQGR